ncbi:MAG: hypothetical protein HY787_04035 [Deltaproteobacteria bacterium]|nr:hypothetical protein [Deltaproteobacteria bacterium]
MVKKIIYKNIEAKNKAGLIKRIDELMEVPSDNVVIFFANQDSTNRPDYKPEYDKYYDNEAFYLDRREDKRFPHIWPDEIQDDLEMFRKNRCEHFIWISKRIGEAEEIHFALIYSHELQHLKQSLKNKYLLIIAKLLEYNDNYGDLNIDLPTEVECEAKAKEILAKIFNQETFEAYIKRMRERGPYESKRYGRLLELNIPVNFDVELEIQKDICKNKEKLRKIQKQREDTRNTDWNIDVDKLCFCRDPHEGIVSSVGKLNQDDGLW